VHKDLPFFLLCSLCLLCKKNYSSTLIESAKLGNAVLSRTRITAGAEMYHSNGHIETALDLASEDTFRALLEHHEGVLVVLWHAPSALLSAVRTHCATMSTPPEAIFVAPGVPLRAYHLIPTLLWAPPPALATVVAWARGVIIAQGAATAQPFSELPDDCAGDILEFLETAMPRAESLQFTTQRLSPEAQAWVHTVLVAAVVVSVLVADAMRMIRVHVLVGTCLSILPS